MRLLDLRAKNKSINEDIGYLLQNRKVAENLKAAISQKHEKIAVLRKLITETQETITRNTEEKKHLIAFNRSMRVKLPKYEDKVRELGDYVTSKGDDMKKRRETYSRCEAELRILIRESIQKLLRYIFPIQRIVGKLEVPTSCEISQLERDLAEATKNISSRERLGFVNESQNDVHHVIVAPFLLGNGDYSDYSEWVTNNKDGVPTTTSGSNTDVVSKPNAAVRISAALTYTAQLLQVLSYYLDVRFPFKIVYSEFCSSMMTEQQLTRRVARLNANILYLCYTQRVKLSNLHPSHTLENILQLLDIENSHLGRAGPVDISDCVLSKNLEKQLIEELDFGDELDSEDENTFPHEWEDVSHNIILASGARELARDHENIPMITHSPNILNPNTQATASMAGGLMTSAAASIASIWRGWANR